MLYKIIFSMNLCNYQIMNKKKYKFEIKIIKLFTLY